MSGRRRRGVLGLALGAALVALVVLPRAAVADGDPPKLEADPARVAAGSAVTIHGIDLPDPGAVSIELIDSAGAAVPLGFATADHTGTLWYVATIPATTRPGALAVRAVLPDGRRIEVPLQVGPALVEGGEQRGADEPLLAPFGSGPAVPAGPPVKAPIPVGAAPETSTDSMVPIIVSLFGVLIVGGSFLIHSRRSRASSTRTRDLP